MFCIRNHHSYTLTDGEPREIGFKKSVDYFPGSLTSLEVIPQESLPKLQENQLHGKYFSCSPSISSLENIRNDFEYVKPDFPDGEPSIVLLRSLYLCIKY